MKLAILLGAAALAVLSTAAFAEDYAGGAIKTADIGGKDLHGQRGSIGVSRPSAASPRSGCRSSPRSASCRSTLATRAWAYCT